MSQNVHLPFFLVDPDTVFCGGLVLKPTLFSMSEILPNCFGSLPVPGKNIKQAIKTNVKDDFDGDLFMKYKKSFC